RLLYEPHCASLPVERRKRTFKVRNAFPRSGRNQFVVLAWLTQHIAAAPYGLDVIAAAARIGELLAQFADENINDLEFRLIHAAVKVIEEHLFRECRTFAQRQEFEHLIFLASQMHAVA